MKKERKKKKKMKSCYIFGDTSSATCHLVIKAYRTPTESSVLTTGKPYTV